MPRGVATGVISAAILWLTLAPQPMGDRELPLFPGADKVAHACMFGALMAALLFDAGYVRAGWRPPRLRVTILCAVIALLAGPLIELLQLHMQLGRSFEWADIAADSAGVLLTLLLMMRMRA